MLCAHPRHLPGENSTPNIDVNNLPLTTERPSRIIVHPRMYFFIQNFGQSLKELLFGLDSSPPTRSNDPIVFEGTATTYQQPVQYFISCDWWRAYLPGCGKRDKAKHVGFDISPPLPLHWNPHAPPVPKKCSAPHILLDISSICRCLWLLGFFIIISFKNL